MRFVRKSRALALCLLFPLTAAGCSGAPSPSSSAAAPTASAVSSAWSSAHMTTTAVTSAVTTSGKASTTQASPASARKTTTSRHAASATKAALATTGKQSTDSGFLNAALFNKGRDAYGGKSINILGDSISHGANAPNIPDHSYVGLLKKAVAKKFGVYNYGFTSLLCTFDNPDGTYQELHTIDLAAGEWGHGGGEGAAGHLGFELYRSLSGQAKMTVTVDRNATDAGRHVKGLYVYYEAGPAQGSFRVEAAGRTLATVDCRRDKTDTCARSPYIPLPANLPAKAEICVVSSGAAPVVITGFGYAEEPNGVTVQNYSRSGLQLVEVGNDVIQSVCRANVVVLALGFNDAGIQADHAAFRNKINRIIRSCEASGAKLVVVDTLWTFQAEKEFYRAELKRAADELGGLYISFTDLAEQNPGMIQDGAHPSVAGHRLVARRICEKLGLPMPE